MKILVQWALVAPEDWQEMDSDEWPRLPKKPVPVGGEGIDNRRGWIFDLNVQGVTFAGYDHYAVSPSDEGAIKVTAWNDDPEDYQPGRFFGIHAYFQDPSPDPDLGGLVNTRQRFEIYAQELVAPYFPPTTNRTLSPWEDFKPASVANTLHGIWLPDHLAKAHSMSRRESNWREWIK